MGQTLSNTFNRYKPDMFKTEEEKALDGFFSQTPSQREENRMAANYRLKMSEEEENKRRFKNTHGNNQASLGNNRFRMNWGSRGAGGGRKSKGRKSKGRKYFRRRTSKLYRKNKRKSKNKRKKRKRRTSKY
tara:strand:+ start:1930 stop:2322 length:393 start_codon:yes stop_codon:yes gene_type:complete